MNQQIKQRWLARLRSGQHGQCRQVLHVVRDGKPLFCVMGVLVDLYIEDHPEEGGWVPGDKKNGLSNYKYSYKGLESVVSPTVRRWAELEGWEITQLLKLNDGIETRPRTLPELADIIEGDIPWRIGE